MSVASADNKNVLVLSDPSALVYNYQTFGFWETGSGTTSSRAAAISVGSATPASAVPTTGTATFQGLTLGGYIDSQGNAYTATSAATLNTNFGSRTINYSTSTTQKFDGSTGQQTAAAKINLLGTLSCNSGTNNFSGAVTTTDGMTGTARGQLYGPSVNATAYGYALAHDTTGASSAFSITPIDAGSYAITAGRGITDIGTAINSADALAALKIAVAINPNPTTNGSQLPVSPFQIMAADINGDGRVNSADALAILKVAVHLSTAITPQWAFVEDTRDFYDEATGLFTLTKTAASWDHNISATVSGGATENLVGVLMGDVNGSWAPPAGSQYVETQNPTYFTNLSNLIHTPISEFGVL